ncbi:replication-associated recombination protein A [Clostridium senegalense]|uniref:replication-associated recombination protein A n=1 Tax=Clostridium senegalense TaxID=1465809 RepID=UPI001FD14FC9|nr:replication-associated recombination protein A [Clostridium senegalense]
MSKMNFENISLFDRDNSQSESNIEIKYNSPLAERLKPETLEDYIGQEHILAKDKLLYRAINADRLSSLILYGPPGIGKTSLARIIAKTTKSKFKSLNAVTSNLKELRETIDEAENSLNMEGKKTIVFIDEIHRFNKNQQDALLPHVEKGRIILVGATTENPFFEVNKALLSRAMIFKLEPLNKKHIEKMIKRALNNKEKGFGNININLQDDALNFLVECSNGDGRRALNALELAVLTTNKDSNGIIDIDLKTIEECIQKKHINYDKNSDNHYDVISAFIKSMRGSDPDAAIHYLARMLYAGEDIEFIARRILIAASEDVGNADPYALLVAKACLDGVKEIGMPEARILLAQAVTYVASAPKSNSSYNAINLALKDMEKEDIGEVPNHLREKGYNGAERLYSDKEKYLYPHDYKNHYVKQQYLPYKIKSKKYYNPSDLGYEGKIKLRLEKLRY